jgi:hypothetical protein
MNIENQIQVARRIKVGLQHDKNRASNDVARSDIQSEIDGLSEIIESLESLAKLRETLRGILS